MSCLHEPFYSPHCIARCHWHLAPEVSSEVQDVMAAARVGKVLGQGAFGQVRHVRLESGHAAIKPVEVI